MRTPPSTSGQVISHHDFPLAVDDQSPEARQIQSNIDMWLTVAKGAMADNTLVAYKQDWMIFCDWCEIHGQSQGYPVAALPATVDTLLAFIDDVIGKRAPASISRCMSTVSTLHDVANVKNPLNHVLVHTAKKKIGTGLKPEKLAIYQRNHALIRRYEHESCLEAGPRTVTESMLPVVGRDICHHNLSGQQRQAAPLTREDLRQLKRVLTVEALEPTAGLPLKRAKSIRRQNAIRLKRARDRALVHVAYDSLLRVSELRRISIDDFDWDNDGSATLTIGQRKDSRHGERAEAYITRESGDEIKRWIAMAGLLSGPLICGLSKGGKLRKNAFGVPSALTSKAVLDVYKTITALLGLEARAFSCHSTRVGAVHDMHAANINMPAVKQAGRWKSDVMPSRYMQKGEARRGAMAQMEKKEVD